MNPATAMPEWSIDFNFEIPPDYHQVFHLLDQDCRLSIEVHGKTITFKSEGGCGRSQLNDHLDWLEECLNSVRAEFGQ